MAILGARSLISCLGRACGALRSVFLPNMAKMASPFSPGQQSPDRAAYLGRGIDVLEVRLKRLGQPQRIVGHVAGVHQFHDGLTSPAQAEPGHRFIPSARIVPSALSRSFSS